MNNNTKIIITINDNRFKQWLKRLLTICMYCFVPIAVGIFVDSSAMQWAGFTLGMLCLFAMLHKSSSDATFTSIEEAEAYLVKMKAGAQ